MMRKPTILFLMVVFVLVWSEVSWSQSLSTAFTYQGRLSDGGSPAAGEYDFKFELYDEPNEAGVQVGSTVSKEDVKVYDGYYTVGLDFGVEVFNGESRWLEVGMRPGELADPNDYTPLTPRQELTPTPYALQSRGIFVDNDLKVGIGTTSPNDDLHVANHIRVGEDPISQNIFGELKHDGGGTGFKINANAGGSWADMHLQTDGTTKLFIESGGHVGIGTTNPGQRLEVKSSGYTDGMIVTSSDDDRLFRVRQNLDGACGVYVYDAYDGANVAIGGSGITYFNAGNVGIGTTSPNSRLTVTDTGESTTQSDLTQLLTYAGINIETEYTINAYTPGVFWSTSNNYSTKPKAGIYLNESSNGTSMYFGTSNDYSTGITNDALVLQYNGNVGIGTTTPTNLLELSSPSPKLYFNRESSSSNVSGLYWRSAADNFEGAFVRNNDTGNIELYTNGNGNTPRVMITDAGNVGIGTSNPLSQLSVGASGDTDYSIYAGGRDTGVYGSGDTWGVHGVGEKYGVAGGSTKYDGSGANYGVHAIASSFVNNTTYAVKAEVYLGGSGTYYSGHFSHFNSGGVYNGLYADLRTGGAIDLAEYILDTEGNTEAGDVLVADPDNDESVIKAAIPYDSTVVGIVSTDPHLVMGMELVMNEETGQMYENVDATMLALAGRVPVKVIDENGPIKRGDLLTTSSKPGYAMKWSLLDVNEAGDFVELKSMLAENERRQHTVMAKALEPLEYGEGIIMALITLQ